MLRCALLPAFLLCICPPCLLAEPSSAEAIALIDHVADHYAHAKAIHLEATITRSAHSVLYDYSSVAQLIAWTTDGNRFRYDGSTVEMRVGLVVRTDYGVTIPWTRRIDSHTLSVVAGPPSLMLRSSLELCADEGDSVALFTLQEAETSTFILSHGPSHLPYPTILDDAKVFLRTKAFWRGWSGRCNEAGKWTEQIFKTTRSG